MATQNGSVQGSGYGNAYIDSLVWGVGWTGGPITYWFGSGDTGAARGDTPRFTAEAWTDSAKAAFAAAVGQYAAVCNLTFQEAGSQAESNLVWWQGAQAVFSPGTAGWHDVPDGTQPQLWGVFNKDDPGFAAMDPGGWGLVLLLHELGHAVGLAHPHDGGDKPDRSLFPGVTSSNDTGTYGLNQSIWTLMSYNFGWKGAPSTAQTNGNAATLMAFDVAALQKIYGANTNTATGSDTYTLPTATAGAGWTCIWDASGADTISAAGSSVGVVINLNDAPLTGSHAGGYISRVGTLNGGFTIANGVVIENATGGSGNDSLIGNEAANMLDGGAGADTLTGGGGDDSYTVDDAGDKVIERLNLGTDTVTALINYTLPSNVENLVLGGTDPLSGTGNSLANLMTGNDANDTLAGAGGADTLSGGAGADVLTGGKGADVFRFADGDSSTGAGNRDVITDFSATAGDKIDLRGWDADANTDGTQAFSYIGRTAFTGKAGELHYVAGVLAGDTDGDGQADFEIELTGVTRVLVTSLILA